MEPIKVLHWVVALALAATLYGHTVFRLDPAVVTPVAGGIAIGTLLLSGLINFLTPTKTNIVGAARQLAVALWIITIILSIGLTLIHYGDRNPNPKDIGLAVLQLGLPLLMLAQTRTGHLLSAIGIVCVCAALVDAAWNCGVLMGILRPVAIAQRLTEYGRLSRNPGLSGSTLAAGLVGLIAVARLAGGLRSSRSAVSGCLLATLLVVVILDIYIIDARRYLAEAAVVIAVLVLPAAKRLLPLPLAALATAAGGIWITFHSLDSENIQRGALMVEGWADAMRVSLTGQGLLYRAPPVGINYQNLWSNGVTESGVISLVIAFGLPTAILFLCACFLALGARRFETKWEAALFAVLVGDLAFSETLDGFLGASVFFACLSFIITDEIGPGACRLTTVFVPTA